MFEIGWSELLIVAIVAIIVVGPRDLPKMLRAFGNTVGKLRRMAGEFQDQFKEALREAELEEARKEIEKLNQANPLNEIRDEVRSIADQARFDPNDYESPPPAAPSPAAPHSDAVQAPTPPPSISESAPPEPAPAPLVETREPDRSTAPAGSA